MRIFLPIYQLIFKLRHFSGFDDDLKVIVKVIESVNRLDFLSKLNFQVLARKILLLFFNFLLNLPRESEKESKFSNKRKICFKPTISLFVKNQNN